MKLKYVNRGGGEHDVTGLATRFVWSGDVAQAARTLEVALPSVAADPYLPKVTIDNGETLVLLTDSGLELFRGRVMRRQAPALPGERLLLAYDGLRGLARSEVTRNWEGRTPEEITRDVCAELGVEVGQLADSGGARCSFPWIGKSAYRAILAAYTRASDASGKTFQPVMRQGYLHVIERGATACARELDGAGGLCDVQYQSSVEDMVNRVLVVDGKGGKTGQEENADDARLYGAMQRVLREEEGKDARAEARKLLAGVANSAAPEEFPGGDDCLDMLTGNAIHIREPVTGLVGKFYIDADTHTFADGQHMVSLGLNFKLAMDREEVEEERRAARAARLARARVGLAARAGLAGAAVAARGAGKVGRDWRAAPDGLEKPDGRAAPEALAALAGCVLRPGPDGEVAVGGVPGLGLSDVFGFGA